MNHFFSCPGRDYFALATQVIMQDPVVDLRGHSYDRSALRALRGRFGLPPDDIIVTPWPPPSLQNCSSITGAFAVVEYDTQDHDRELVCASGFQDPTNYSSRGW